MKNTWTNIRHYLLPLAACLLAAPVMAQESTTTPVFTPSLTPYGVPGLTNVTSSEAVGQGVLNFSFRGTYYKQDVTVPGVVADAQVTTASGGAALGMNDYLDLFVGLNIFNSSAPSTATSGFGSVILGAKGTLPTAASDRFRLGVQVAGIFGTGSNPLSTNRADGYNYLEARSSGDNDLLVRFTQSLLMTDKNKGGVGFNIHLNEGIVSSFEPGTGVLLITGAGLEVIPMSQLILGLEINSRTFLKDPNPADPFWVTPSVTYRTTKSMNVNAGVDVSLSPDRSAAAPQSLAPWRAFAGLTASLDTRKNVKAANAAKAREDRAAAARARSDSAENVSLHRELNDADKTADSLARVNAAKDASKQATADSLAAKAHQDSVILAATQRALSAEKSKRSDAEKQLLSTGLLLMDAVYFETGKTDISINSKPYLNIIAKMLVKYPKLQIEVAGHSDNVGGEAYNMNLSQGRSESVRAYMTMVAPELKGRLSAKGYGMSMPKADNNTESGRMHNRRTELQVLNKAALREYNQ